MFGNEGVVEVNIREFLEEGRKYIDQNNPVQASEKLYKASEEAVKKLAEHFDIPEHGEARGKGRWTAPLLFGAVRRLSEKVNPEILNWWNSAWVVHVEGFHEARLNIEEVKIRVKHIEELVNLAQKG